MKSIFVNLKRFDIPQQDGGICPADDPVKWVESIIAESIELGLGQKANLQLHYMLPEGLVHPALEKRAQFASDSTYNLHIGIQGVYPQDVRVGGNFGAFTTFTPAAAAAALGAEWALIGHSEERKDKLSIMARYDPEIAHNADKREKASAAVSALINEEAHCALGRGIRVLLCIGETAEERGEGSFNQQQVRIRRALESQIAISLQGINEKITDRARVVIGYEPIWAIGPGKTPPDVEYIAFVTTLIKSATMQLHGFEPAVVYGGGLKEENAASIAAIPNLDGGLVGLTHFVPPIGFDVAGLSKIIERYQSAFREGKR